MKKGNCSICGEFKELSKGNLSNKTGERLYRTYCTDCQKEKKAKHYQKNKEYCDTKSKQWAEENREKSRQIKKKWRDGNPNYLKEYKKVNRFRFNAANGKRKAVKVSSTPLWVNEFFVKEAYDLANLRTKMTGIEWHVDHIVPLQHKDACGLHTEDNLQVIPAALNLRKKHYNMDKYGWSDCFAN